MSSAIKNYNFAFLFYIEDLC